MGRTTYSWLRTDIVLDSLEQALHDRQKGPWRVIESVVWKRSTTSTKGRLGVNTAKCNSLDLI